MRAQESTELSGNLVWYVLFILPTCGLSIKAPIFCAGLILGGRVWYSFKDLGLVCWPVFLILFSLLLAWTANGSSASLDCQPLLQSPRDAVTFSNFSVVSGSGPRRNSSRWLPLVWPLVSWETCSHSVFSSVCLVLFFLWAGLPHSQCFSNVAVK